MTTYAQRIIELENEGLTTSDAQAAADAEELAGRVFAFDPERPMDGTPVFDSYGFPINTAAWWRATQPRR